MPNKTLSVTERDLPLWERGERAAERHRMSTSGLVLTALAAYLGEDTMDTITVEMYGGDAGHHHVRFTGRWLVAPPPDAPSLGDRGPDPAADDPASGHDGRPEEWRAGIAETGRGRIAIYLRHWDGMAPTELHDADTLDDAATTLAGDTRIPRDTWTRARELLQGGHPAIWHDI